MVRLKKITVIGLISLGIFATNLTAYAKADVLPMGNPIISTTATTPACPRCHTNKWVIPHGLVSWVCSRCNYNFW